MIEFLALPIIVLLAGFAGFNLGMAYEKYKRMKEIK